MKKIIEKRLLNISIIVSYSYIIIAYFVYNFLINLSCKLNEKIFSIKKFYLLFFNISKFVLTAVYI